ncbi:DUF4177 domain-containing protein [Desulfocastanea catecholica]
MRWSYKTIHYALKKEGLLGSAFLDEPEIELSLNQYGKAGWELVSLLETMDGLIAVFKQPLDLDIRTVSPPESPAERISRSPKVVEKRTPTLANRFDQRNDEASRDEDIAEAMLLDDFEIVEERVEQADRKRPAAKPASPAADVGSIRIE